MRLATPSASWRLRVLPDDNHFHLVVLGRARSHVARMHALNFGAQAFNRRPTVAVTSSRSASRTVVRRRLHLGNACAYVLENAHRAGLCAPS